jgi:hypothetical protein
LASIKSSVVKGFEKIFSKKNEKKFGKQETTTVCLPPPIQKVKRDKLKSSLI